MENVTRVITRPRTYCNAGLVNLSGLLSIGTIVSSGLYAVLCGLCVFSLRSLRLRIFFTAEDAKLKTQSFAKG